MEKNKETVIELDTDKNEPVPIEPGKTYRIIIPQGKEVTYKPLSGAHFDLGKSFLRPSCKEEMDDIVTLINDNPDGKVMIFGHTDTSGKAKKNKELALQRALIMKAAIENDADRWFEVYEKEEWGVREAQYALKTVGYDLECTGKRNDATDTAIKEFRKSEGLGSAIYLFKEGWEILIEKYLDKISPSLSLDGKMAEAGEGGVVSCSEANPVISIYGPEALNRRTIVAVLKSIDSYPCDTPECKAETEQKDPVEVLSCPFYREHIKESTGEHQVEATWGVEEAREGDAVPLCIEGDLPEGAEVEFSIFENDEESTDEMIIEGLKTNVSGGKAEATWVYQYFEDEEDAPEFEEISGHGPQFKGPGSYNPPEYYFVAKVANSEARSPVLNYKTTLDIEPEGGGFSDEEFILYHSKGEVAGTLSGGRLIAEDIPPGDYHYIIRTEGES